ncbi:hypothetical protein SETIT_5G077000v2 [Setaria italica]|uniref:SIAH-type domain-containing protein n=1 Tax=Setaria italica TaxID=4555 RepID=A0A368R2C2_SETIT|nr:hypothetical protein SETIT_5G077000v2 [Setaria italica]
MNRRTSKKTKVTPAAAPSTSSPRKNTATGRKGDDEEMEKNIWLDPDALSVDCGICFMPFEAEAALHELHHYGDVSIICATTATSHARSAASASTESVVLATSPSAIRLNRKCWSCDEPIGDVRCRPVENILGEMNTICKFRKYGCGETIKYIDKRKHEETCPRAPYYCPVGGCSYRGLLLYRHVLDDHAAAAASVAYGQATTVTLHKGAPFCVLVQAGMGRVFLLLNGGGVLAGRSLSLVCLGPRPEGNVEINYKMEVRGSEPGALSLAGTVPCIRLLEGYEAKKFLFVPDADWGPSGTVSVSIRIG